MMKVNKIPVVLVLLVFSWIIATFGSLVGLYCIIYRVPDKNFTLIGIIFILVSLLVASIVRILANIGQVAFDLNNSFLLQMNNLNQNLSLQTQSLNQNLSLQTQSLSQNLSLQVKELILKMQELKQDIDARIESLGKELSLKEDALSQGQALKVKEILSTLEKMKSDLDSISVNSKDSNINISQIRSFFSEIEKHLDLKK